ncbi:uncharacterized [Tachysurus ichikawai]
MKWVRPEARKASPSHRGPSATLTAVSKEKKRLDFFPSCTAELPAAPCVIQNRPPNETATPNNRDRCHSNH